MNPDETPATEEGAPQVPWRPIEAVAVFFIALGALLALSLPLAGVLLLGEDGTDTDLLIAVDIALLPICLAASVYLWVRLRYRAGLAALGIGRPEGRLVRAGVLTALGGVGITAVLGIVITQLIELGRDEPFEAPQQIPFQAEEPGGLLLALTGLSVIVLAPIAEEMFYRGFLYPALRRRRTVRRAVVISAIWFGISHFQFASDGGGSILGTVVDSSVIVIPIGVLGGLFAVMVERYRSLIPAMVAHALFNTFGFILLFLV